MSSAARPSLRSLVLSTVAGLAFMGVLAAMPWWMGAGAGSGWAGFVGRFHPLMLHLPIGIVCLAALLEVAHCTNRPKVPQGAGWLVLGAGALSAVVAVVTGILLYRSGGDGPTELAERHQWGGIAFACGMIVVLLAKGWAEALGRGGWFYRGLLFSNVAVMAFASHDGGSLTHGPDFLTANAPEVVRKFLNLPTKAAIETVKPLEEKAVYAGIIAPVLEQRCNSCHNESKAKGKLRTDTHAFLLKGGKEGPSVIAGDPSASPLIVRAELPEDDEERMPPDGKPGFTADELAVIKWWITLGADPVKSVGESNPPEEVKAAIEKVVATGGGVGSSDGVK